jgi:hypothetical protein
LLLAPSGTGGERESIALTSAGTLDAPGAATVVCRDDTASGNWVFRTMTAVKVANLTLPAALELKDTAVEESESHRTVSALGTSCRP